MFPDEQPRTEVREHVRHSTVPYISASEATGCSLAGTLGMMLGGAGLASMDQHQGVGGVLAGVGVLIGPSLGYHAAGLTTRGNQGNLLRCTAAVVGLAAVISRPRQSVLYATDVYGPNDSHPQYGVAAHDAVAWTSAAVVVGSMLWDIAMVGRHVEKAEQHRRIWVQELEPPPTEVRPGWTLTGGALGGEISGSPAGLETQRRLPDFPDASAYLKQSATWSFTTPTACK